MTRSQKVQALVETWPVDYRLMLEAHFFRHWPKAAKDYRVVSKWLNRMKRVRRVVDKNKG